MRAPRTQRSATPVLLALVLFASSCASATQPSISMASAPTPSAASTADLWVAVIGVADAPGTLSDDRDAIISDLGDALEGAVVISPVACLDGLPPGETGDSYVLAIQQSSRAEVRALVSQTSEQPRFIGPVHLLCTD